MSDVAFGGSPYRPQHWARAYQSRPPASNRENEDVSPTVAVGHLHNDTLVQASKKGRAASTS